MKKKKLTTYDKLTDRQKADRKKFEVADLSKEFTGKIKQCGKCDKDFKQSQQYWHICSSCTSENKNESEFGMFEAFGKMPNEKERKNMKFTKHVDWVDVENPDDIHVRATIGEEQIEDTIRAD